MSDFRTHISALWPLLLIALAALPATALTRALPERSGQSQNVTVQTDPTAECSVIAPLLSQRAPVKGGPELWGFGRMGGLGVQACGPGTLSFAAYRKDVQNTPSRWEVYLDGQLIEAGEVSGSEPQSVQIAIPAAGAVSLIFSNAYADPVDVKNRRTLYVTDVQLGAEQ